MLVIFCLLSWTKWIILFEVHVSQSVVDLSVMSLVSSDGQDHISHHRCLPQSPVVDSNVWSGESAPHG